ncbi:M61 family metallopeptidase [Tunturibacter empetritectus]|uniref:Metalloprotease with PDZ domain n=1 Tax=Tunturiibacter empetritectus TaxID=3069691 RepID=A0A7W8MT54_9BACT|nr:M61 family metallopeptidase [Edaphobacter lichenicola]MBB5317834.1 putative metalloprotease with PDZ domain [Edaphobacter lichenicola]
MIVRRTLLPLALLTLGTPALLQAQQTPIQITADLSEAPRKLYHAEVDIPVQPGPVSLTTPKWIPGNHRPTGPVDDITGVVFTVNGPGGTKTVLPWRRDDEDLYEFHVTVPAGVTTLHAHLDCIVTARVTDKLAVLEWEKLLLYPAKTPVKDIAIQPSVIVPAGWGIGTALTIASTSQNGLSGPFSPGPPVVTTYAPTTVEQLEDSPVITGQYFHEFALAPEVTPRHYIDVVSDSPEDSNLRPALLAELNNLVRETGAAYDSRHYNVYHFLLTLSDVAGGEGLEHGQSSDNGVGEKGFSDPSHQLGESDLLSHEFTHSWNGKYRRPFNLYQDDFEKMQQGSLLWVYEGMTQYLGNVLAARSGLKSQEQYRDMLALSAANLDYKPGREWRSTEDTAISASILRGGNPAWSNWKRGQDYYQEGELFWLDADTLIRQKTDNKKSLTDFLHLFLGKGGNTGPSIVTYNRDELIADLNQVYKYDWATFIHERIDNINPRADLAGIERGGYKLVFTDEPTKSERTLANSGSRRGSSVNVWYSLGLRVSAEGNIADIRWNSPADKAKFFPGEKIIAINGNVYSADALKTAIKQAKGTSEPIHFILQSDAFVTTADIDYHDGARYPQLVRVDGTPAYLDDITKPLAKSEPIPAEKKEKEKDSTE